MTYLYGEPDQFGMSGAWAGRGGMSRLFLPILEPGEMAAHEGEDPRSGCARHRPCASSMAEPNRQWSGGSGAQRNAPRWGPALRSR